MNTTRLYHRDIGFPKLPMRPTLVTLQYGSHARREALEDRYGDIKLPRQVLLKRETLVEIEMTGRSVTKLVTRHHYDELHDLVIVLVPQNNFVKTVWLNRKNDDHQTLDRTQYDRP